MNPARSLYRDRTVIWPGRAAEDAYQPRGLFVASHHTAGNRRDCSIAAGGALRCGDIRKNEQGGCGKREIDHIGFHVVALAKLDPC